MDHHHLYFVVLLVLAATLLAVAVGWYRDRAARRTFEATLEPDEIEELRFLSAVAGILGTARYLSTTAPLRLA